MNADVHLQSIDVAKTATIPDQIFIGKGTVYRVERIKVDGVMGLAPDPKYTTPFKRLNENRYLLNELKKHKIIDRAVFSLYITDFGFESKITFGKYDREIVKAANNEVPPYYKNLISIDRLYWLETLGDA